MLPSLIYCMAVTRSRPCAAVSPSMSLSDNASVQTFKDVSANKALTCLVTLSQGAEYDVFIGFPQVPRPKCPDSTITSSRLLSSRSPDAHYVMSRGNYYTEAFDIYL